MNIPFQRFNAAATLLEDDDVLPTLEAWRDNGLRTALVTLVAVEGGAPRAPGAQMAVAEDGRYVGYLSGGCLEQAVALEAQSVIAAGANRLVRYGKGSPYFDIRLPCGSGLDLYFDQAVETADIGRLLRARATRRAVALVTNLATGRSHVEDLTSSSVTSVRRADVFRRVYPAPIHLALLGTGPAVVAMATVARAIGLELSVWSTDDITRGQLAAIGIGATSAELDLDTLVSALDPASAAVVVLHDHDAEPQLLSKLLSTPCFYVGVLGNRAVHRARVEALSASGIDAEQLARLRAPVGIISNAKSKATFAIGVMAELLAEAKQRHLIS